MISALLVVPIAAFIGSSILCGLSRGLHQRLHLIDQPGREQHKQHTSSVPYGGGPAMLVTLALVVVIAMVTGWIAVDHSHQSGLLAVWGGTLGLAALGWVDDRWPLPARLKLLIQTLIITASIVGAGLKIDILATQPALAYGLAIAWCVIIANAYNLLDHADGMSSVIAIISLVVLVSASLINADWELATFHLGLIGVLGGFLMWNLPPARLYMGDSGSLPLGFLVATGCLQVTFWDSGASATGQMGLFAPLLVSAIPLYDVAVVVVKRLRHRNPIMRGDRNHISHRLSRLGLSPMATLGAVAALQTAIAGSALLLRDADYTSGVIILFQAASVVLAAVLLEARRDDYQ